MALLSSTRAVGVIGSIMAILFVVPGVGSALGVVGWILIVVAAYLLAQRVNDRGIFNNVLVAGILAIVGFVALAAIALTSVLHFASANGMGVGLTSLTNLNRTALASGKVHGLGALIVGVLAGVVVLWVFLVVSAIFIRRSYDEISRKFNVKMFSTAALVYLIGAALSIVLIGLVIVFIAEILQAIAFYSLPDQLPSEVERPVPMTVPPPPPQQM